MRARTGDAGWHQSAPVRGCSFLPDVFNARTSSGRTTLLGCQLQHHVVAVERRHNDDTDSLIHVTLLERKLTFLSLGVAGLQTRYLADALRYYSHSDR